MQQAKPMSRATGSTTGGWSGRGWRSVTVLAAGLVVLVGCGSGSSDLVGTSVVSSAVSSSSTVTLTSSSTASSTDSASAISAASPASTSVAPGTTEASATPSAATAPATSEPPPADLTAEGGDTAPFTGNPDNVPVTAPGTALRITDPATLPISYAFNDAVVTFSAMSLTMGDIADWPTLGSQDGQDNGDVPWYLRVTITQVAGGDLSNGNLDEDLQAYTSAGDLVEPTFDIDYANTLCPKTATATDFTIGSSYTSCIVLSGISGDTLNKVTYEGGSSFQKYFDSPVVWTTG